MTKVLTILIIPVVALAMYFALPECPPGHPVPFDPDLTELQISHAPKDADIMFLGDSITERWRFRPELWATFGKAANLGVGGSRTANLLWLVESGKLSVFHPQYFVVRIGANDMIPRAFWQKRNPSQSEIDAGIETITANLKRQFPKAVTIVMRNPLPDELAGDGIHLNDLGYQRWEKYIHSVIPANRSDPAVTGHT